jgi:hypothetical protein
LKLNICARAAKLKPMAHHTGRDASMMPGIDQQDGLARAVRIQV